MKTSRLYKISSALVCLALVAMLGAGCGKPSSSSSSKSESSSSGGTPSTPEESKKALAAVDRNVPASVTPNSFNQVAAQLDPGGVFYMYMGTEQFLSGLSGKMGDVRNLLTGLPDMTATDRANVGKIMDVVTGIVKNSGVEEVSGFGASGVEIEKGVYMNKMIVHHYPGRNKGLLWTMFGKEPHALTGLDYMPQNTAMAMWGDVDAAQAWSFLKEQIEAANIPELSKGFNDGLKQAERQLGVSVDKLMDSMGGEVGFVMTLDPSKTQALPTGAGQPKLDIPDLAMAIVVKVKDESLFNLLDKLMQANPQTAKTDKDGLKMRTMQLPLPLPVRPSIALAGDYLFLASTDTMINEMLAVKSGKSKSLKTFAEFKKATHGIALEGNSFSYVSPEIRRTIMRIVGTVADWQSANGQADRSADMLEKLMGDKDAFSFSVASNTKDGWVSQSCSDQHPAMAFLAPMLVAPMAVAAGVALPNLQRARNQAQGNAQNSGCMNNLKQIGLAARLYANDHNDVLPKSFQDMKDELASPKVLICPQSGKTASAATWANFNFADVTYQMVSPGLSVTNAPNTVFVRCPIHGTACYLDGSVRTESQRGAAPRPAAPAARAGQPAQR
jgi:hypothetical protein